MREQKTKEYLRAIYVVGLNGPVRGAYVAREMNLSRATVSVSLQALEERGYVSIDDTHIIHLTGAGEQMAKEAIHETVNKGLDYHAIAKQIREKEDFSGNSDEKHREQVMRWLVREKAEDLQEAILILSRRYYAVRVIDVARFLDKSSHSVRPKLKRMEQNDCLVVDEENVIQLTDLGKELAEALYDRHAPKRKTLIRAGMTLNEAERLVLLS